MEAFLLNMDNSVNFNLCFIYFQHFLNFSMTSTAFDCCVICSTCKI